jgi:glycosyltransferase involved in cell wall biosynthesis
MRILYDGNIYKLQRFGGVNNYVAELINHLPLEWCPMVTTVDDYTRQTIHHPQSRVYYYHRFGLRNNRVSFALEPLYFNWVEFWSRADILHPTFYFPLSQRQWQSYRRPLVMTVYDLIHEIFPALDPQRRVIQARLELLKAAAVIICISENTKQDLYRFYPFTRSKVVYVTPLATSFSRRLVEYEGGGLFPECPYFLYVGSRWFYKNVDLVWQAIAALKSQYPDLCLKMVGKPFSDAELERLTVLGIRERVVQVDVSDDRMLARLYAQSAALIYPSLYEGFGLPPLEAMACGTVVIAANAASIPEVVGTAGLLFDPNQLDELVARMTAVLDCPGERDRWIAAGREQVQQFSWSKVAEQTTQIYQTLR